MVFISVIRATGIFIIFLGLTVAAVTLQAGYFHSQDGRISFVVDDHWKVSNIPAVERQRDEVIFARHRDEQAFIFIMNAPRLDYPLEQDFFTAFDARYLRKLLPGKWKWGKAQIQDVSIAEDWRFPLVEQAVVELKNDRSYYKRQTKVVNRKIQAQYLEETYLVRTFSHKTNGRFILVALVVEKRSWSNFETAFHEFLVSLHY